MLADEFNYWRGEGEVSGKGLRVSRRIGEQYTPAANAAGANAGPPVFQSDWKGFIKFGHPLDSVKGPVTVLEFSDLECPVCKRYEQTLRTIRKKYPDKVSIVFVHFPLAQHRFARPAADAAECAAQAQVFTQFVSAVYEHQDSLGLKSWSSYARDAGLADTARFASCVSAQSVHSSIDSGLAIGQRIGVHGTPTIVVNGWRFTTPPAEAQLIAAIDKTLEGGHP